jgi:hypothetical protein
MDSNAIKEIANQLGVGADYLLNHLSEFAPKWAAMQVAKSGVICVLMAIMLVVSAYLLVKATRSYSESGLDYDKESASFAMILVFGFVTLFALIFLSVSATNLAMHIASPEAAMLNDMLEAVRQ